MTIAVTSYDPRRIAAGCPSWCAESHLPPEIDDGIHCAEPLAVLTSRHMRDDIDWPEEMTVSIQQWPGEAPFVVLDHRDEMLDSEDRLTPGEAEQLAGLLEKNAAILRANRGCMSWCEGGHDPADGHCGPIQTVPLSLMAGDLDVTVAIIREPWERSASVHVVSHDGSMFAGLVPAEADQLARHLRRHAAAVVTEEGSR